MSHRTRRDVDAMTAAIAADVDDDNGIVMMMLV